jgi:hypothetical protein
MTRKRIALRIAALLTAGAAGLLICCGAALAQGTWSTLRGSFSSANGNSTQESAGRAQTERHPPNPNVTSRVHQWQTNETVKYALAHTVRVTVTGSRPAGNGGFADGSDSAIIVVLRRQSVTARSLLLPAVQSNQGQPGAAGAALMNNRSKVGLNATPMLGPSQTMSASETRGPGTSTGPMAATPSNGLTRPHSAGGERPVSNRKIGERAPTPTELCKAGIAMVDGAANGVWFSPVPGNEGRFVIQGCGFGSTPGEVYLSGVQYDPARTRQMVQHLRMSMCPGCVYFRIQPTGWSDRQIVADIDPNASGLYDTNNVMLNVKTAGGQVYQVPGMNFLAARADQVLQRLVRTAYPTGPDSCYGLTLTQCVIPGINLAVVNSSVGPLTPDVESPTKYWLNPGQSIAVVRGVIYLHPTDSYSVNFPSGTDTYQFHFAPGFQLDPNNGVQMSHASMDAGHCESLGGVYSNSGNWSVSYTSTSSFQVHWEEEACSPGSAAAKNKPGAIGTTSGLVGFSAYELQITVIGPRGVSPLASGSVSGLGTMQMQPAQLLKKQ